MNSRLFSQIVPFFLFGCFLAINLTRMRELRQFVTEKPHTPEPDLGNTHQLHIGTDTVYITEQEYRSLMRRFYFSFLFIGLAALSIILGPVMARGLRP
jgi:hypothetical protein